MDLILIENKRIDDKLKNFWIMNKKYKDIEENNNI